MRVVAAPNPYKGSLSAPEAADAIRRGVLRVWSDAEVLEAAPRWSSWRPPPACPWCRAVSGGDDLPRGGASLRRLARIDASAVDPGWHEIEVSVACDVTNPLLGPQGATAVFGPQKGVTPELVPELDGALARLAEVIARTSVPGSPTSRVRAPRAGPGPGWWPSSEPGSCRAPPWWWRRRAWITPRAGGVGRGR